MSNLGWCLPCALAEPRQYVEAVTVIDDEPMCRPCAESATEPKPVPSAPTAKPKFGECSRGCGNPTHRGRCKSPTKETPHAVHLALRKVSGPVAKKKTIRLDAEKLVVGPFSGLSLSARGAWITMELRLPTNGRCSIEGLSRMLGAIAVDEAKALVQEIHKAGLLRDDFRNLVRDVQEERNG